MSRARRWGTSSLEDVTVVAAEVVEAVICDRDAAAGLDQEPQEEVGIGGGCAGVPPRTGLDEVSAVIGRGDEGRCTQVPLVRTLRGGPLEIACRPVAPQVWNASST